METKPKNLKRLRLPAAILSGSLLVGNTVLGAQALAKTPPPEPAATAPGELPQDISDLKVFLVKHRAAVQAAKLLADHPHVVTVPNGEYAAWSKVAVCEEGGWIGSSGYAFPDSLGITRANWFANGGGNDVNPAAQIHVANTMIRRLGISIPDQNGCQPGGW